MVPLDVLIDTNVFIERESDWEVPAALQKLENLLRTNGHRILIHPLSKEEISKYENDEKRATIESKIETYAELGFPMYPRSSNVEFREQIPRADSFNEQVDNALLFSVWHEETDFLITEDKGMRAKAEVLGISEKVLAMAEGRNQFKQEGPAYQGPPSIERVPVSDLSVEDSIFQSLKRSYDFEDWFSNISEKGRNAYVNWNPDGSLGAVLILKPNEAEAVGVSPPLAKRNRLKISTLKVATERRGSKIGELLISIAIREAIDHEIEEIYLTHEVEDNDYLVQLIAQYGFMSKSTTDTGDKVFVKRLTPGLDEDPDPAAINTRYYPSFYDGEGTDKFLIPIRPEYHGRLFPTYNRRNTKLTEFSGGFVTEGNAIKKAYLCHANIRKIDKDDVLLFYRTYDHMEITSLCVCDRIEYGVESIEEVETIVGKRSVFSRSEINDLLQRPLTVILFRWHFELGNPIHYKVLLDQNILLGPLQTTQQLDEKSYQYIRGHGGIDERFAID